MANLKRTGVYEAHVQEGAKLVPFAGWEMPVQYQSIRDEHIAVRTAAGIFDVSHMGEILFSGPDALANVQRLVSNDAARIKPNRVIYSGLLYPEGTFVDDVLVYRLAEDSFLFCVNAANTPKDFHWIQQNLEGDLICENVSDEYTQLAIQGPKSLDILQPLTNVDLSKMRYYRFKQDRIAGVDAIISRTGYTGELGFELYFNPSSSMDVWNAVMKSGKPLGLVPAGLGCRDTLRLEAGMALYGNDIDNMHTPLEAGLEWIVKLDKDDFIGKDALESQQAEGITRRLVGFEMADRGIARQGYPIFRGGEQIGEVTSGTLSITLNKAIGMGYVETGHHEPGTGIEIQIRNRNVKANIVALPFYSQTR